MLAACGRVCAGWLSTFPSSSSCFWEHSRVASQLRHGVPLGFFGDAEVWV